LHVVGRDSFRDRAGGGACKKKLTRNFLTSTDLRDGTVFAIIEVDPQCLVHCGTSADVLVHKILREVARRVVAGIRAGVRLRC